MSDSLDFGRWEPETAAQLRDKSRQRIAELEAQVEKLQRFKDWVHAYLDARGVPHHPPGTHGAAGCRVGDRMDWLVAQLADADGRAAANGVRAANLDELLGASMRANLKDAAGWAARVAEAQAEVERLRREAVPQDAHDLLSAGMGRSEELRSELKHRCRELEALLKPFADAYAEALACSPSLEVDHPDGGAFLFRKPRMAAWRAAHRALIEFQHLSGGDDATD